MKIQDSTLNKIKPPSKRYLRIWDSDLKGFGVRVYDSGIISFVYLYRNSTGHEKQFVIGKNLKAKDARNIAQQLAGEVARGECPVTKKKNARIKGQRFSDLATKYLEEHVEKNNSQRTISCYKGYLTYTAIHLKEKQLTDIAEEDIRRIQEVALKEKGKRSSNAIVTMLKSMFNLAVKRWKMLEKNPCVPVVKYKIQPRTERFSEGDLHRIIKSIEQEDSPVVSSFFKMLIHTGCRRGELQHMKWADVRLDEGEWCKPTTKTGEPHFVALNKPSLEILGQLKLLNAGEFVFEGRKSGKPINGFSKFWKRITERAGLANVTIHDIRRSLGYLLLSKDVPIERVSQILGHKSIRTTERVYAKLELKAKRQTVDLIGEIFSEAK
ncbi:MAG: site-specific integrase [Planctomycetes bacterium]|nr:site-specific integrase [Planctomycetota bacterium]